MRCLLFIFSLVSLDSFAWGPTGHRVVGAVAEKHLSSQVSLKVKKILQGQSLSRASTWADEIKSDPETYGHTFNWHYTDWKDEDQQHDETHSSGKLLSTIDEQLKTLRNPKASEASKRFSLKFIVHLIGDLHQPLHVGNGLDQGGNKCKVMFHQKETNLHALWDEKMIEFTRLSYTELTDYIPQGKTKKEIAQWRQGSVVDWAKESKLLRPQIYPEAPKKTHPYCGNDQTISEEQMPKLGYEYSYKFLPMAETRLFQAGIRLAKLLNENLR